ncbi:MAG: PfkB family carbohydrate kinase, partial [Candidatus Borkfalkia sp.]
MVICIGEILADLIGGTAQDGAVVYTRCAGGAPFNVACGVKAVGGACGFIGRVGDDLTGKFLQAFAREKHFEFLNIETDPSHNT